MLAQRLSSWRPSGNGIMLALAAPAVLYLALAVPRLHVEHAPEVVTSWPFAARGYAVTCAVLASGGLVAAGTLLATKRGSGLPKLKRRAWLLVLLAVSVLGFSYAAAGSSVAAWDPAVGELFTFVATGPLAVGALLHIVFDGKYLGPLKTPSLTSSVERRRHRSRWRTRSGR